VTATGWGLVGALLVAAGHAEARPRGPSPSDDDWATHVGLVDQLAWAATDRQVRSYLRTLRRDDESLFARSLVPAHRHLMRRHGPHPVYAVEAELLEELPGADRRLVHLREAVVYTNPSRRPLSSITFRVFANGRHVFPGAARVLDVRQGVHRVPHELDGSLLTVNLDEPLPPGRTARLLIELVEDIQPFDPTSGPADDAALPAEEVGGLGFHRDRVHLGGFLAVATPVDPTGRFDRRPLPPSGEYAVFDPAHFHVVFDLASDRQLITSGIEVARRSDADRQTVVAVAALTRDFAAVAGRGLTSSAHTIGDLTVRVHFDEQAEVMGRHLLRWASDASELFVETYGLPAMAEIDLVEGPLRVALGQEFHGLAIVDLDDDDGSYVRNDDDAWTVAHELAHQWWSGDVGSDARDAPWLDEALSSHGSALYWERVHGRESAEARLRADAVEPARQMKEEGMADLPADLPASDYHLWQYSVIVYGRAAMFVDRVRQALGPDAFARAMARYADRHRAQSATADDLLRAWRREADDPSVIDRLYQEWITTPAREGLMEGR